MRQPPIRKGSSTKTVMSVIAPGTDLVVPEYEQPTDFKTKLEAATEKIKAYKAFFYNRDQRPDKNEECELLIDPSPEIKRSSTRKKRAAPRQTSKSSKEVVTAILKLDQERQSWAIPGR